MIHICTVQTTLWGGRHGVLIQIMELQKKEHKSKKFETSSGTTGFRLSPVVITSIECRFFTSSSNIFHHIHSSSVFLNDHCGILL